MKGKLAFNIFVHLCKYQKFLLMTNMNLHARGETISKFEKRELKNIIKWIQVYAQKHKLKIIIVFYKKNWRSIKRNISDDYITKFKKGK